MSGDATFQIDSAELYLGSDKNLNSVFFLTNSKNLKNLTKQQESLDSNRIDYPRLISSSFVKEVTMKQLKKLT